MNIKQEIIEKAIRNSGITLITDVGEFTNICIEREAQHAIGANGAFVHDIHPGSYLPVWNTIYLGMELFHDYSLVTFFHELAHATRITKEVYRTLPYAVEEIVAETTAKLLMKHFGLNTEYTDERSDMYISKYSLGLAEIDLELAAIKADKVVDFILNNWLFEYQERKVV